MELDPPSISTAVVYIYAPDTETIDLGQMAAEIQVNGQSVLLIDEGYFARIELAPGMYALSASTDSQMACGGKLFPGSRYQPIELLLSEGEVHFLRYSSHPVAKKAPTCDRYIKSVSEIEAITQMQRLREVAHQYQ